MTPYKLSFTFGGLLIPETREIARSFLQEKDWNRVRERVMEENVLSKTRSASRFRYFREIRDRLKQAYNWELEFIGKGSRVEEIRLVILVVTARFYRFIFDFIVEVVRPKVFSQDIMFTDYDYASFIDSKMNGHEELASKTELTRRKIEQVTFRILKEAGITTKREGAVCINKPIVPEWLRVKYEESNDRDALTVLLLSNREIGR